MKVKNRKQSCPICKKEVPWEGNKSRPFCSRRCMLIDLGKWASGEYRIAGDKKDMADGDKKEKNNLQG